MALIRRQADRRRAASLLFGPDLTLVRPGGGSAVAGLICAAIATAGLWSLILELSADQAGWLIMGIVTGAAIVAAVARGAIGRSERVTTVRRLRHAAPRRLGSVAVGEHASILGVLRAACGDRLAPSGERCLCYRVGSGSLLDWYEEAGDPDPKDLVLEVGKDRVALRADEMMVIGRWYPVRAAALSDGSAAHWEMRIRDGDLVVVSGVLRELADSGAPSTHSPYRAPGVRKVLAPPPGQKLVVAVTSVVSEL